MFYNKIHAWVPNVTQLQGSGHGRDKGDFSYLEIREENVLFLLKRIGSFLSVYISMCAFLSAVHVYMQCIYTCALRVIYLFLLIYLYFYFILLFIKCSFSFVLACLIASSCRKMPTLWICAASVLAKPRSCFAARIRSVGFRYLENDCKGKKK